MLHFDLCNPLTSWADKAEVFNEELEKERLVVQAMSPEARKMRLLVQRADTPDSFMPGAVAQLVNRLRKLVQITPPPDRQDKFG